MKDYFRITRKDYPCLYELGWLPEIPGIEVRVHSDFVASREAVPEDAPIVNCMKESFGFKEFVGDLEKDFGFDGSLMNMGREGEFIRLRVALPDFDRKTCGECGGSGRRDEEFYEGKCLFCMGTGYQKVYRWQRAYAISASLEIFSRLTRFPEEKTSSFLKQLLKIRVFCARDERLIVGLGGEFSIPLCDWFRKRGVGYVPEIVEAMEIAYSHMQDLPSLYEFRAAIDYPNGWLNVSCPGNACGINPCHNAVREEGGYEFVDHNLDTPFQQLTLLAGLAALHDAARKAGVGT